ncbi:MAG: DNA topoisomerase 3 [Lentisphaeraceae bacterium]|nr:DNA topoisomerase 3 [Lentisphaeraceae bacterium]
MKVILAEKPSVARDIARVLGARTKKDGYIEGSGYQVTWAFGHLVELQPPDAYDPALKNWTMAPLPFIPESFKLKLSKMKGVSKQFNIIKSLFSKSSEIICATDAGREGELIFRYIAQLCSVKRKPAKRLWISSLTDSAIRQGFSRLQPLQNYNALADAARCRSEADWIIGLNATRAYTVKHSHGRGVLSVGRVQTPVLAMIVNRDQEIRNFKPEDYWELWTKYRDVKFKHTQDRFIKADEATQILQKISNQELVISDIIEKKSSQMAPKLFDLTDLQRTMNRKASFPATKTLAIAQKLYESKYISYPRTDSRYLSDDIYPTCGPILDKLKTIKPNEISSLNTQQLAKHRNYFNSSKVSDHHAIIPTGLVPSSLDRDEQKVFHEITTRFIAIFYPACEKAHTTVTAICQNESFKTKGTVIIKEGWLSLYGGGQKDKDEQILPQFTVGESGSHDPEVKKCQTKPPHHFNESSLLSAMETAGKEIDDDDLKDAMKERGLGTAATRASIIETLVKRDYITKNKRLLLATPKGEDLIRLLGSQQTLTSPELTGDWEHKLKLMEKGEVKADDFMGEVRGFAHQIIDTLNSKEVNDALGFGNCPLCASPVIKGKVGYGCSAWKTGCKFRFHAEQFGSKIKDEDVPALLSAGRLNRPRKLTQTDGTEVSGYISMNKQGILYILTREAKVSADAIASCPLCKGNVMDSYKAFSCDSCDFAIWKKIAGRTTSKSLAQVLINKGRSQKLKGFRSKAGKRFSAVLVLKDGKVEFNFE